jgi:membrane protein
MRLTRRARLRAFGRATAELFGDKLTDRAAAMTYYGILAIFPGLLVLVAAFSLLGTPAARSVVDGVRSLSFGPTQQVLAEGISAIPTFNRRDLGIIALVSLAIAFYSSTGYVGAFIRATYDMYDGAEPRPVWRMIPIRFMVTVLTGSFLALSALVVVFTGWFATELGSLVGLAPNRVRVLTVVRWPVLVVAFGLLLALLYWTAPHSRRVGFRWITSGTILATTVWVIVSACFAFYVTNFDSYNRIYGALGGVVVFLVWTWLTNVAVLFGAEFDAELSREREALREVPAAEVGEGDDGQDAYYREENRGAVP